MYPGTRWNKNEERPLSFSFGRKINLLDHIQSHVELPEPVLINQIILPKSMVSDDEINLYKAFVKLQVSSLLELRLPSGVLANESRLTQKKLFDFYLFPLLEHYSSCGLSYSTDNDKGFVFVCLCCSKEGKRDFTIGVGTGSILGNMKHHFLTNKAHIKRMDDYLKNQNGVKQTRMTNYFASTTNINLVSTLSVFKNKDLAKLCYGYRPNPDSTAEIMNLKYGPYTPPKKYTSSYPESEILERNECTSIW